MDLVPILILLAKAVLVGLPILAFLVLIHEAGHFLMAKWSKVKVEEFGFGFPPRIWGKKIGETVYSLNAIIAGGFVRLFGEEGDHADKARSFASKTPSTRASIIVAGAIINILFAWLLFSFLLPFNGFRVDMPLFLPSTGEEINISFPFGTQENKVLILDVEKDSPADLAGVKELDTVETVNGEMVSSIKDLQSVIKENEGQSMTFTLYNLGERTTKTVTAVPRTEVEENQGALGIGLDRSVTVRYESIAEKVFVGPLHSVNLIYFQGKALGTLFSTAVEERTADPIRETVRGPVGIVVILGLIVDRVTAGGIYTVLDTVALISLALGILNLLPIPAFDGGRLFFVLIEGITRKKLNPAIERWTNTVAFGVLILLFIVVTINDIDFIRRLFGML
jgi:regulator of sigma E protease